MGNYTSCSKWLFLNIPFLSWIGFLLWISPCHLLRHSCSPPFHPLVLIVPNTDHIRHSCCHARPNDRPDNPPGSNPAHASLKQIEVAYAHCGFSSDSFQWALCRKTSCGFCPIILHSFIHRLRTI